MKEHNLNCEVNIIECRSVLILVVIR